MVSRKKCRLFLGQNFWMWPENSFLLRTSILVNGAFVALGVTVDLAPSDRFFDFSFPSYGRFLEGDNILVPVFGV